jgi:hypothetical protein
MDETTWGYQLAEVVQLTNAIESQMKGVIAAYFDIAEGAMLDRKQLECAIKSLGTDRLAAPEIWAVRWGREAAPLLTEETPLTGEGASGIEC